MRSWIIGSATDCDVVVDSPLASARHCQLTQTIEGDLLLNDLGSTNGTYVNGVRIAGPVRFTAGDSITLGRTLPFPWPPELTTSFRIGRLADNDIVIDDQRVSGYHARLTVVAGFHFFVEDIGSSNGTFLNGADRRLTGPTAITESDTLYLGTLAVPAARLLLGARKPQLAASAPPPPTAALPAKGRSPLAGLAALGEYRWLLAWMVQVPIFGVLIPLFLGRPASAANWQAVEQGIASTTFALALAAIWLGGSLAIAVVAPGRIPIHQAGIDRAKSWILFVKRIAVMAAFCFVGCAVLLAIVQSGSGLKGPWPAMWGVLVMTSLASLFLGLTVSGSVRSLAAATAVLLICFATMIALGGWIRPLPKMRLPLQYVAEAMPSRWAFEGLYLLETAHHSTPANLEERDTSRNYDLVEELFPANSERMGVRADTMALASMLIGLATLAVFISGPSRVVP